MVDVFEKIENRSDRSELSKTVENFVENVSLSHYYNNY